MEEAIPATSDTGTSWDAQLAENSDMDIDLSIDNIDEIMPTLDEYTSITSPMDGNNTLLPNQQHTENQLRELIETFTGADSMSNIESVATYGNLPNQTEETNQMLDTVDASWLSFDQSTIDTNEASNQQRDLKVMPVAEETLVPDTVTNSNIVQANLQSWSAQLLIRNHYLITKDHEEINHIIPVTDQIISVTHPFWLSETMNTNQVPVTDQIIPGTDHSWSAETMDTNQVPVTDQTIPDTDLSWLAETMNTNQVPVTDKIIPDTDLTWSAETINTNQVPVTDQIIPDTDQILPDTDPSWSAETMNTNQVPESSQAESMDLTMPTAEPPWVELGTQPVVNTNQVGLQWGLALIYPDQVTSNQLEANDTNMPTADNAEAAWEVGMESLNDPQISEQQPLECTRNSPGLSATMEEVQTSYQSENDIIAIPLVTDPNTTPEIVTFRPGIYEGDAIPPIYSNFTIIAAPSDYEPSLPSPIYPELTIIPLNQTIESFPENQIVTEPINSDVETTVDQRTLEEPLNSNVAIAKDVVKKGQEAAKDIDEQELLTNTSVPSTKTKSGYKGIDAKVLSTLHQIKLILVYQGYHYSRHFSRGKKICWRCVSRRCKAYLYTDGNKITVTHPHHNHLTVISQNIMNQEIKPDVDGDLSDSDSTLNEAENAFDSNMMLSQDCSSQRNAEEYDDPSDIIQSVRDYVKNFDSNQVLTSENNIIPHDPSLEITVKSPLVLKQTNEDIASSVTNTVISVPDPLDICVTSYTPPIANEAFDSRKCSFCNDGIPSRSNHMTVPKNCKVKVTISTKPRTSKPLIYYDGKLAQECTRKKSKKSKYTVPTTTQFSTIGMTNAPYIFPPAPPGIPVNSGNTRNSLRYDQSTNHFSTAPTSTGILNVSLRTNQNPYISSANVPITPVTENIQTFNIASSSTTTVPNTYTKTTNSLTGNIATAKPLRNIHSSQIVTYSDPEYHLTFNTPVSQAQTQTPEDNMPLAVTSAGSGTFSQSSRSPAVSTTTARSTMQRPGLNASTRTSNLVTVPRPRTMIPTGYTHQRYRLARARNAKPKSD